MIILDLLFRAAQKKNPCFFPWGLSHVLAAVTCAAPGSCRWCASGVLPVRATAADAGADTDNVWLGDGSGGASEKRHRLDSAGRRARAAS